MCTWKQLYTVNKYDLLQHSRLMSRWKRTPITHSIDTLKKSYSSTNQKIMLTKPAAIANKSFQLGKKWILSLREDLWGKNQPANRILLTSGERYSFPGKGERRQAVLTQHSCWALYWTVLTNAIIRQKQDTDPSW